MVIKFGGIAIHTEENLADLMFSAVPRIVERFYVLYDMCKRL